MHKWMVDARHVSVLGKPPREPAKMRADKMVSEIRYSITKRIRLYLQKIMEFFKLTLQDRNPNPLQDAGELEGLEEPTQRLKRTYPSLRYRPMQAHIKTRSIDE